MNQTNLIIVMGVSGCGKSTLAAALARELDYAHVEADDFHSEENRAHMTSGRPLTDAMRAPWIESLIRHLNKLAAEGKNAVMSFSGLRAAHRAQIKTVPMHAITLHLHGSMSVLESRLKNRRGHFMPANLLASQMQTLESPLAELNTYQLNIDCDVNEQVILAKKILQSAKSNYEN